MLFRRFFILLAIVALGVVLVDCAVAEGRGHRNHAWVDTLSPEQREAVERIVDEAQPRLQQLRLDVRKKMAELQSFAYRHDEDMNVLTRLGKELQDLRDKLREELQALDARLVQEAGVAPRPNRGRSCSSLDSRAAPQMEGDFRAR